MPCPLSPAPLFPFPASPAQNLPSTPHPLSQVSDPTFPPDSHTPCVHSPPQISTLPSKTCSMPSEANSPSRLRIFVQSSSPSHTACPSRGSSTQTLVTPSRKVWINRRSPFPGRYVSALSFDTSQQARRRPPPLPSTLRYS